MAIPVFVGITITIMATIGLAAMVITTTLITAPDIEKFAALVGIVVIRA